jgi:hypothetical protein
MPKIAHFLAGTLNDKPTLPPFPKTATCSKRENVNIYYVYPL